MVDFTRQRQFKTREAVLLVDKGLPPGIHTFELVVADGSGNQGRAARVRVEIVRLTVPVVPGVPVTPVIRDPITPIITPAAPVGPTRPGRPGRRPRPG